MNIKNNNAFELWKEALSFIKDKGRDFTDNDNRTCREVFNMIVCLENVDEAEINKPIEKMINSENWIYPSKEELSSIMFKEFQAPIYEYTYGGRIFGYNENFDQINSFIIPLLKADPGSRRAILVFYNPSEDSNRSNKNTPGIIYIQFRVIDDSLHMTCHIRSNDLFFGWPANVYQSYCLMEYLSKKLELKNGSITIFSNSAHVFVDDFTNADEIINR